MRYTTTQINGGQALFTMDSGTVNGKGEPITFVFGDRKARIMLQALSDPAALSAALSAYVGESPAAPTPVPAPTPAATVPAPTPVPVATVPVPVPTPATVPTPRVKWRHDRASMAKTVTVKGQTYGLRAKDGHTYVWVEMANGMPSHWRLRNPHSGTPINFDAPVTTPAPAPIKATVPVKATVPTPTPAPTPDKCELTGKTVLRDIVDGETIVRLYVDGTYRLILMSATVPTPAARPVPASIA